MGCGASVEKPTDDGDAKVTSNEPVKQKEAPEEKPQEKPVPPAPAPPAAPAAPPKEEHAPAAAAAAPKAPEAPEAEKSAEAPVAHPSESHTGGADWVTSRGTEVQAVHYNVHKWYFDNGVPVPDETHSTITPKGPKADKLVILHMNDVYEIGSGKIEPVGGAARFQTMLLRHMGDNPLVLFSGDALNPSILSQVTHGGHMIEALNQMCLSAACVGNHDLDLGEPNLEKWIERSNFPWLCSNCWHKETGAPLGIFAQEAVVVTHNGFKIGIMGLIEDDWLACCTTVNPETLDYKDFVEVGRKLAAKLRAEEGCDFIIALTHFREPNDERLAAEAPEIDIVLGGHDHHYSCKKVEPTGTYYVKSGADFKWLSRIEMHVGAGGHGRGDVHVQKLEVDSSVEEDPAVKAIADHYLDNLKAAMGRELGKLGCDMDARFAMVRTEETNCGNWVADIARRGCKADCALINSGTLRADVIYPAGSFTVEDMVKLLPFENHLVSVGVTGAALLEILENGVSQWPKKEGRFPQVSEIKFTFDGNKPSGERVVADSVTVAGEPLDREKEYVVACLDLAASGKEGYEAFTRGRVVRDAEQNSDLKTLVRNEMCLLQVNRALLAIRRSVANTSVQHLQKWQNRVKERKSQLNLGAGGKPTARDEDWFAGATATTTEDVTVVNPQVEGRITNLAVTEPAAPAEA